MKKKKSKIHCIIFKKGYKSITDVYSWCHKNRDKMDIELKKRRDKIKKIDGDYILILRPRYRFVTVLTKKQGNIKIVRGLLK